MSLDMDDVDLSIFLNVADLPGAVSALAKVDGSFKYEQAYLGSDPDGLLIEFADRRLALLNAFKPMLLESAKQPVYEEVVDFDAFPILLAFGNEVVGESGDVVRELAELVGRVVKCVLTSFDGESAPAVILTAG